MASSLIRPSYHQGFARSAGESKYQGLWKGLVGAWNPSLGVTGFTLFDQSPFKNHGTLTNMAADAWVATEKGMALEFDRSNDYVDVGAINIAGWSAITIFALINYTSEGSPEHTVISNWDGSNSLASILMRIEPNSPVDTLDGFLIMEVSTQIGGGFTDLIITPNTWQTVALTYSQGQGELRGFVNGKQSATTYPSSATLDTGASPVMWIGDSDHAASDKFGGKIAVVYLYERALLPSEIILLNLNPFAPFQLADIPIGFVSGAPPVGGLFKLVGDGGLVGQGSQIVGSGGLVN